MRAEDQGEMEALSIQHELKYIERFTPARRRSQKSGRVSCRY